MAIKWIVMDMDGTLLNKQDKIGDETKATLMKCQEMGIKLILASGRSYRRLDRYAKELKMDEHNGYIIEVNGMAFKDVETGKRTIFKRIQQPEIARLFDFFKDKNVELQGYIDAGVYDYIPASVFTKKQEERMTRKLSDDFPWTGGAWSYLADCRDGYPDIHYVCDWRMMSYEINKLSVLQDEETIKNLYPTMMKQFGEDFEIVRTCPRLIEINPRGISKGATLARLMEEENVGHDEVLVFGDGENDVDMFSKVKYCIAMDNAKEYVKKHAYKITKSNNEEGIAYMIKELIKL